MALQGKKKRSHFGFIAYPTIWKKKETRRSPVVFITILALFFPSCCSCTCLGIEHSISVQTSKKCDMCDLRRYTCHNILIILPIRIFILFFSIKKKKNIAIIDCYKCNHSFFFVQKNSFIKIDVFFFSFQIVVFFCTIKEKKIKKIFFLRLI